MKKTIIALAVAGLSFNVAAVDLDDKDQATNGVAIYAAEAKVEDGTVLNGGTVADLDSTVELGKAVTEDSEFFVRIELTNASFNTALDVTDLTVGTASTPASAIQGGNSLTKAAIFTVTAPAGGFDKDDAVELALADVVVDGPGDVGITYKLYSSLQAAEALNGTGTPVVTKSGTLATYKTAVIAGITEDEAPTLVISEDFKGFNSGSTTTTTTAALGTIEIKNNSDVAGLDGQEAKVINDTAGTLVVTGSFAGVDAATGVVIDSTPTRTPADTLVGSKATFDVFAQGQFEFTVDGETELDNSDYTAVFTPVLADATAYKLLQSTYSFNLGKISKDIASDELNLALSSDTSFNQYIRVTNTDSKPATALRFTVYDANGKSGKVSLADIAAKGSSTPVSVKDLFAQAKADNASLSETSLLRIKVEGEARDEALSIQSYVLAKDANSVNNLN